MGRPVPIGVVPGASRQGARTPRQDNLGHLTAEAVRGDCVFHQPEIAPASLDGGIETGQPAPPALTYRTTVCPPRRLGSGRSELAVPGPPRQTQQAKPETRPLARQGPTVVAEADHRLSIGGPEQEGTPASRRKQMGHHRCWRCFLGGRWNLRGAPCLASATVPAYRTLPAARL